MTHPCAHVHCVYNRKWVCAIQYDTINALCTCSQALARPQLVAMVELLCLMQGLSVQLKEAEAWLLPLLNQAMHSVTQTFVATTIPALNKQGSAGKVSYHILPCRSSYWTLVLCNYRQGGCQAFIDGTRK